MKIAESISLSTIQPLLGRFFAVKQIARNQFVIEFMDGEIFQSYSTVCGVKLHGQDGTRLYLSPAHDYSVTTNKYVGQWSGMGVAERRKGLVDGSIIRLSVGSMVW